MLTKKERKYYKEEYESGHRLFYVRYSHKKVYDRTNAYVPLEFIFRTLTVKEYELIVQTYHDKFEREDAICNIACIYPEEYDFSKTEYGVMPSVLSTYILKYSACDDPEAIYREYQLIKDNTNMYQQCMDLIKAFIGDYTYEEMEEWTWQKLMTMTVRAENVAKLKGFDYHLDKIEQEPKMSIHNEEDVQKVLESHMLPGIYFKDEIEEDLKANLNIVTPPFILGVNWNNKEYLDGFRKQKAYINKQQT